ncbi:hypothetical protein HMPREF3204_00494 [Gardnerella pickettii]|nr:hypothetical protein HMPREF3204_00494 [Gardnerella pickettii]
MRLYRVYGVSSYNRTTQTNKTVVRLYLILVFFNTNALQEKS